MYKKIIDSSFDKEDACSLILRFAGFSFFSEKSEKDACRIISEERIYHMKEIVGILIIYGVKNFDFFDMNLLCKAIDCSMNDIKKIMNSELLKKYLPLRINETYVNENKKRCRKEINNIRSYENEKSVYQKNKMERIEKSINRFEDWVKEGKIIISET